MSSLFSDPPFRRGTTLLQGEAIETDASTGNPVAGGEIVGQVKVFQDVNPSTGARYSNRLVYCVAARYKGTTVSDATTVAGEVYLCDFSNPMAAFTTKGTASNVLVGLAYGVLDEYLTGELRQNDIVWLVVKGPADVKQTAAAINAGAQVQVSATAGSIATFTSGLCIGQQIKGSNTTAAAQLTRVNLIGYEIG
jgi:hypothetical protein